ncbi:Ferritin [Taenia crassiceps]|uniref:Ferritin n=1 Tax=Taenia crassiceps TaxID=6207 RepID=A0ABR4Q1G9_9CEST
MESYAKVVILFLLICVSFAELPPSSINAYTLEVELQKNLNDQINLEYEAFYLYEQLAAYFARSDKALFGFSAYFRKAADEERHHAHELIEIMNKRMGTVTLKNVEIPITTPTTWRTSATALQMVLAKEIEVLQHLNGVYTKAQDLNDYHIQDRLDHFVHEQATAIFKLRSLITRVEGKSDAVEYLVDQELLNRPSMHD